MIDHIKPTTELEQSLWNGNQRLEQEKDDLLKALEYLVTSGEPERWCDFGLGDPRLNDHSLGCRLASRAFAKIHYGKHCGGEMRLIAAQSYAVADAMLEARGTP